MKRTSRRVFFLATGLFLIACMIMGTGLITTVTLLQFQNVFQPETISYELTDSNFSTNPSLWGDLSRFQVTKDEIERNLGNSDWFLETILTFGKAISEINNTEQLAPGPFANTVFGGLVEVVREFPHFNVSHILNDHRIQSIRPRMLKMCSAAEYLLEATFGRQVLAAEKELTDFLYLENYQLLIEFEITYLKEYLQVDKLDNITQVAMIGSGPLPLTSIELLNHLPFANVTNYDQNEEAIDIGKGVVASKKLSNRISSITTTALSILDLRGADIVYLAALAGQNPVEKKKIVEHLFNIMKPGSLLIARSSFGLRTLLYQQITAEDFGDFEHFKHFNPNNKVIVNSIAVGRRPAKDIA